MCCVGELESDLSDISSTISCVEFSGFEKKTKIICVGLWDSELWVMEDVETISLGGESNIALKESLFSRGH